MVVAFGVLALAGLTHPDRKDLRELLADLRAGFRRSREEDRLDFVPTPRESSLEELFAVSPDDRPPYVVPEELPVLPVVRRRVLPAVRERVLRRAHRARDREPVGR